ncbi:MAG: DnaJ domain-containing protein [Ahrensia sp.]
MTTLIVLIGLIGSLILAVWAFATSSPAAVAQAMRYSLPALTALVGIITMLAGRIGMGLPILGFALAMFARAHKVARSAPSPNQSSYVRTAMLEMELDHDTGQMNGLVLAGKHEGAVLDNMSDEALFELAADVAQDRESAELLEAYLDRRMPGWREGMDADTSAGQGGPAESGPMTHQEAYQILGLETGASIVEIRKAHRRLMQGVHPDVGGSSFLAARINAAKDLLVRLHDK